MSFTGTTEGKKKEREEQGEEEQGEEEGTVDS